MTKPQKSCKVKTMKEFSVRVSLDVYGDLVKIADREKRSLSNLVMILLSEALNSRSRKD
jgi:hypothetical protein